MTTSLQNILKRNTKLSNNNNITIYIENNYNFFSLPFPVLSFILDKSLKIIGKISIYEWFLKFCDTHYDRLNENKIKYFIETHNEYFYENILKTPLKETYNIFFVKMNISEYIFLKWKRNFILYFFYQYSDIIDWTSKKIQNIETRYSIPFYVKFAKINIESEHLLFIKEDEKQWFFIISIINNLEKSVYYFLEKNNYIISKTLLNKILLKKIRVEFIDEKPVIINTTGKKRLNQKEENLQMIFLGLTKE